MRNSRIREARAAVDPPALEPADTKTAKTNAIQEKTLDELKEKLEIARYHDDVEQNLECCLCPTAKTDKRLVILGSQLVLSILIVCFCFYKLAKSGEDDSERVYVTLLSSVFSYWTGRSTSSGAKG